MTSDSSPPPGVAERLNALRRLYIAETADEGRARLSQARSRIERPFAVLVAARLQELRALCDLATHLHQKPTPPL